MTRSHSLLVWSIAILTLLSYVTAALFMSQGFLPLTFLGEHFFDTVIQIFAIECVFACLLALIAMHLNHLPEHPAILRLPKSKSARWALGFTAVFYPFVIIFTGNTLFDFMRMLGLTEETFQSVFPLVETLGLWAIAASAVGAFVMMLVALIKNKDRALVLGLPLVPPILVFGFIIGEILGHG